MTDKVTSIRVDEDLWKDFKVECARIERSMQSVLEELIRDFLAKD